MSSTNVASWKNGCNRSLAVAALLVQREGTETHDWGQNWNECIWKIFLENKIAYHPNVQGKVIYLDSIRDTQTKVACPYIKDILKRWQGSVILLNAKENRLLNGKYFSLSPVSLESKWLLIVKSDFLLFPTNQKIL